MFLNKIQSPSAWSSVHRDIIFKFQYPLASAFARNTGGMCRLEVYATAMPVIRVGDMVYVESTGVYNGWHTVTAKINANQFVTNKAYVSDQTISARFLYIPEILIYAGIPGNAAKPNRLLASASPIYDIYDSNQITFNVSAYLKSDFPIYPPAVGADIMLWTQYTLYQAIAGAGPKSMGAYKAANSTLPHSEMMAFEASGKALNPMRPIRFSCGKTIFSTISNGNQVINDAFGGATGGTGEPGEGLDSEAGERLMTENGKIILIDG